MFPDGTFRGIMDWFSSGATPFQPATPLPAEGIPRTGHAPQG